MSVGFHRHNQAHDAQLEFNKKGLKCHQYSDIQYILFMKGSTAALPQKYKLEKIKLQK